MTGRKPLAQVLALGTAQTIAWASSTYLPAILAAPIASELGVSTSAVFGAFSIALVVMALAGPPVGRAIDRRGGRGVLALSSLVLAAGLVALGLAHGAIGLYVAWLVLGLGMALGLYDSAFAALVWIHGPQARSPITGITLIAGFASTVGWPLTAFLAQRYGWRECCYVWAALNLLLCLPLNLWCLSAPPHEPVAEPAKQNSSRTAPAPNPGEERRTFILLALWFAATAFVTSALAAHLPRLLAAAGATTVAALAASALLGPAQVAARLTEFVAQRRWRFHPLLTARIATACHPVGGLVLAIFGGAPLVASIFAVVHGAGNGMITIAKGTLPLALFGAAGYGYRQGLLAILARGMQALAPFAFAVVLEGFGARAAIGLSAGVSLFALGALIGLRARTEARG